MHNALQVNYTCIVQFIARFGFKVELGIVRSHNAPGISFVLL